MNAAWSAVVALLLALSPLLGLAWWARRVPTRALGEAAGGPAGQHRLWLAALLVVWQALAGVALLGPAAGLVLPACAWMLGGWLFTLALNQGPQATLAVAERLGALATVALVPAVALAVF